MSAGMITIQDVEKLFSNSTKYDIKVKQLFPIKTKPLGILGVFGTIAVMSAHMLLNSTYGNDVKFIATTESVMNADEKSPLYISKYYIKRLLELKKLELLVLQDKLDESNVVQVLKEFSNYFEHYSMHVSGMPSHLLSVISFISLGQKWLYASEEKIYYIL